MFHLKGFLLIVPSKMEMGLVFVPRSHSVGIIYDVAVRAIKKNDETHDVMHEIPSSSSGVILQNFLKTHSSLLLFLLVFAGTTQNHIPIVSNSPCRTNKESTKPSATWIAVPALP